MGICIVGIADFVTGSQIWFGPAYFSVIGIAAWTLGWRPAVAVGVAILAITLTLNGFELYPYSGVASAWNIGMRALAVLVLIGMLHTARQMHDREWRLSRTDPLTGALNRKAFFEITSSQTHSRRSSLLVYADLDGFKWLNDTFGHAAGDECLVGFVRQLTRAMRKGDVLARVGGDEFAIYLDVKDALAAKAVAVRLHAAMNAVELPRGGHVKCSVGALILPPGPRSIDQELGGADELMYAAKGRGSSLVVGTADYDSGVLSVGERCELTPEAQNSQPVCNSKTPAYLETGGAAVRQRLSAVA